MRRLVVAVVVLALLGSGVGLVAAGLLGDDPAGRSGPYPEPTPEAGSEVAPATGARPTSTARTSTGRRATTTSARP